MAFRDPGAHSIGIGSDGERSVRDYMAAVALLDGPLIDAVGDPTYSSTARLTHETLQQLFGPLSSARNISSSHAIVRQPIAGQCPACPSLPILVTECNSGPGRGSTQWAGTFADASFLAAYTAQALEVNPSMFPIYDLPAGRPATARRSAGPSCTRTARRGRKACGPPGSSRSSRRGRCTTPR